MAHLLVSTGPNAGRYFQLAGRPLSAGRDQARDIQLLDPKVSRKHFVVRRVDDDYVLIPFRSVNPVQVNGQALDGDTVLHDRDRIEVGDTMLQYFVDDEDDRTNALDLHKVASRHAWEERTINDIG